MKKQETIFKVGDKVFDYLYGCGEVEVIKNDTAYWIGVQFARNTEIYTGEGAPFYGGSPALSFTEYTLEGFSQERPLTETEKDTLIYVRDSSTSDWIMRYFSHFNEQGKVETYLDQKTSKQTSHTIPRYEYSLTNPLTEGVTK